MFPDGGHTLHNIKVLCHLHISHSARHLYIFFLMDGNPTCFRNYLLSFIFRIYPNTPIRYQIAGATIELHAWLFLIMRLQRRHLWHTGHSVCAPSQRLIRKARSANNNKTLQTRPPGLEDGSNVHPCCVRLQLLSWLNVALWHRHSRHRNVSERLFSVRKCCKRL